MPGGAVFMEEDSHSITQTNPSLFSILKLKDVKNNNNITSALKDY